MQTAIKASKSGDWEAVVSPEGGVSVTAGGLDLVEGEFTLETVVGSESGDSATGMLAGGGFVVLDTVVTPELAEEGLARDLVRAVQQLRRDSGFEVVDRIALTIGGSPAVLGRRPDARGPDREGDAGDVVRRRGRRRTVTSRDVGDGETATVAVGR